MGDAIFDHCLAGELRAFALSLLLQLLGLERPIFVVLAKLSEFIVIVLGTANLEKFAYKAKVAIYWEFGIGLGDQLLQE